MAKSPKVPFRKGRKLCIFCGDPADSEEHLWPQWAKHILPASPGHVRFTASGRRSTGYLDRKRYERQGSVNTVRIKRVCRQCNSGWMSGCETDIRFNLERLIQGERVFLTEVAQRRLAQYITYKLMIADWVDGEAIMPPEWPQSFYRDRTIPGNTNIWIFNCYEGGWRHALRSEALGFSSLENWHPDLKKNTKSFAIGIGNLFVFAVFCVEVDLDLEFDTPSAFRLWPPKRDLLVWPIRQPIDSAEANHISMSLQQIGKNNPNVIDIGER